MLVCSGSQLWLCRDQLSFRPQGGSGRLQARSWDQTSPIYSISFLNHCYQSCCLHCKRQEYETNMVKVLEAIPLTKISYTAILSVGVSQVYLCGQWYPVTGQGGLSTYNPIYQMAPGTQNSLFPLFLMASPFHLQFQCPLPTQALSSYCISKVHGHSSGTSNDSLTPSPFLVCFLVCITQIQSFIYILVYIFITSPSTRNVSEDFLCLIHWSNLNLAQSKGSVNLGWINTFQKPLFILLSSRLCPRHIFNYLLS